MIENEILQYANYALWITLIVIITIIINRLAKRRAAAKKSMLHPLVNLFSYEFPKASGKITFFFEADEAMQYCFFIKNTNNHESTIIAQGNCRKGGQKIHFDTTSLPNGTYFYGIETPYQRVEKRIIIEN
jgi:hypothetical protein